MQLKPEPQGLAEHSLISEKLKHSFGHWVILVILSIHIEKLAFQGLTDTSQLKSVHIFLCFVPLKALKVLTLTLMTAL